MDIKRKVFKAARDGKLKVMKIFLNGESRENVYSLISARTNGTTPLCMACRNGHLKVALYLVRNCNADIEQVGTVTYDKVVIEGAPPLFCAAAGGHLDIVKMLVKYNASVNSTGKDNCTALYVACYSGHFEIAKYLIQHGADIEIASNADNTTCLMAVCCNDHYNIAKYLLKCGADMNRKNDTGCTALHGCAQSGSIAILKMLLKNGAKFLCDSDGTTPLSTAIVHGHSEVVVYLLCTFNFTKKQKVNALELLGCFFIREDMDVRNTFECWKRAMELRYEGGGFSLVKPSIRSPIASCIDATEILTLHELEELVYQPNEMSIQALLVVERIFGTDHSDTFYYIMIIGDRCIKNGNFHRCLKLWIYTLDNIQLMAQNELVLLLSFVELFSSMMVEDWPVERGLPPVPFQDILHVFEINLKKIEKDESVSTTQMDEDDISDFEDSLVTAIHLIGLMCRLQPHLNIYEDTKLKKAAYELVHLKPRGRNGLTLLHLACCRDSSSIGDRFSAIKFPSAEVVHLLLEVGASPNALDVAHNTALHVAAMNMPCSPAVFKALVNHGAHLDHCNHERKTPLQLAEIRPFLDDYSMSYINLKCLCARAIRKHGIAYEGFVHEKLKEFLVLH